MRQGVTADQMMKPLGQVCNGENYPLFDRPDCGVIAKVFAPTFTSASTTLGYLSLQSSPVRVSNCTSPRSMRANMRKPSSLISWSHCGPEGAVSTSRQSWGGIQRGSGDALLIRPGGEPDLAAGEIERFPFATCHEAHVIAQSSTKTSRLQTEEIGLEPPRLLEPDVQS